MSTKEILHRYVTGPALLRNSLAGLSEADINAKPDAKKWSIKEIVLHIADIEMVGTFRMKRIIAEGGRYPGIDQDQWAEGLRYEARSLEPSLLLLEAIRQEMGQILTLPETDWSRTGQHESGGEQSLQDVFAAFTGHLEHHVLRIKELREHLKK